MPISTPLQSATGTGTTTSFTVTLGSTPTDGNTLILGLGAQSSNRITSISQTGATWQKAVATSYGEGEIWYAKGISGAGTTITIHMRENTSAVATVSEFSGLVTPYLDQTASNYGFTTAPNSGTTPTTTHTNELWYGFLAMLPGSSGEAFTNPTNGFTGINTISSADNSLFGGSFYKIASSLSSSSNPASVGATAQASSLDFSIIGSYALSGDPEIASFTGIFTPELTTTSTPSFSGSSGSLTGALSNSEQIIATISNIIYTYDPSASPRTLNQYTAQKNGTTISLTRNWSFNLAAAESILEVLFVNSTDIYLFLSPSAVERVSSAGVSNWKTSVSNSTLPYLLSGSNLLSLNLTSDIIGSNIGAQLISIATLDGSSILTNYDTGFTAGGSSYQASSTFRDNTSIFGFILLNDQSTGVAPCGQSSLVTGNLQLIKIVGSGTGISHTTTNIPTDFGVGWNSLLAIDSGTGFFRPVNENGIGLMAIRGFETDNANNWRERHIGYTLNGQTLTQAVSVSHNPFNSPSSCPPGSLSSSLLPDPWKTLVDTPNNLVVGKNSIIIWTATSLSSYSLDGTTLNWTVATSVSGRMNWISQDFICIGTIVYNLSNGSTAIALPSSPGQVLITHSGLVISGLPSNATLYGTF